MRIAPSQERKHFGDNKGIAVNIGDMVDEWSCASIHDIGYGVTAYFFTNPAAPGRKISTKGMHAGHTDADIAARVGRTPGYDDPVAKRKAKWPANRGSTKAHVMIGDTDTTGQSCA
jgi:hypothetical protein